MTGSDVKDRLKATRVWKSIFRSRGGNQARVVSNSVFLHLHPVRVPERRIRFWYTMCLGGISFALFLILTVTGVVLMFYYRPTVPQAYWDVKELEFVVSSGMFLCTSTSG